ncbi:hypothetical protein TWF696_005737 [Orbilia brochopaga]|uniref:Uncharacterized protein n=1 Tax=Orbilia brochopaga TaxID=3140254 RepID=A0AAV9UVE5_9PEZI
MRIVGFWFNYIGLVGLTVFLTHISGIHGLRVTVPWSPYWTRYINEQYYTLRRIAQWIDILKDVYTEDLPLGLRDEPLLAPEQRELSLTYLIDTLHVALDQFDQALVELRERAMPPCPMEDQVFVTQGLQRWDCGSLNDMESISRFLSLVVSTSTQARDYLVGVRRSSYFLIGLRSPDIIGGPRVSNDNDRHIVALSVSLADGKLNMRTRRITIDTEGSTKFLEKWGKVWQRLETEVEFLQTAYIDAVTFLRSPEWTRLIRQWNPRPEGQIDWTIPNVLSQMITWYEGWIRPLEGMLRGVARLGPVPTGPPHWQQRDIDEVNGLYGRTGPGGDLVL